MSVVDFEIWDLVELAWIWWEESQSLLEFKDYAQRKLRYIVHKATHGDPNAQLYIDVVNWAYETRLTLTKIFIDRTRNLPIDEWAKVRMELQFPLEKLLHPLEELQVELESRAFNTLDNVYARCYARGDRDAFVSLFLQLPYKLRKRYLESATSYWRRSIEKFLGSEIMEIMDKARVEVKVVLNVEDVIPLIKAYGDNWREKLRELVKKEVMDVVKHIS